MGSSSKTVASSQVLVQPEEQNLTGGNDCSYSGFDFIEDIDFDDVLPGLLDVLESDTRPTSLLAAQDSLFLRQGSQLLPTSTSNLLSGILSHGLEQLPSATLCPHPGGEQQQQKQVTRALANAPSGSAPGVLNLSVNSGPSQLWLDKAYNPFFIPASRSSHQPTWQGAARQQHEASGQPRAAPSASQSTRVLDGVPSSSAGAPLTAIQAALGSSAGVSSWRFDQQTSQQLPHPLLLQPTQSSIHPGKQQVILKGQLSQQNAETAAQFSQVLDIPHIPINAAYGEVLLQRLMHLGPRQAWDPSVLPQWPSITACGGDPPQKHGESRLCMASEQPGGGPSNPCWLNASFPPTSSSPAHILAKGKDSRAAQTSPQTCCGGCKKCVKCIEMAAMKVAMQRQVVVREEQMLGGVIFPSGVLSSPATQASSKTAPCHVQGGAKGTQLTQVAKEEAPKPLSSSLIPPKQGSVNPGFPGSTHSSGRDQREGGDGEAEQAGARVERRRSVATAGRRTDSSCSPTASTVPSRTGQVAVCPQGHSSGKLGGNADASTSQGRAAQESETIREKARVRARRARARKQQLIQDLTAKNKSLKRCVRRLYRCMSLWGSQGYLTSQQAAEFLAAGQQNDCLTDDESGSDTE